jgi:hypothetical protein
MPSATKSTKHRRVQRSITTIRSNPLSAIRTSRRCRIFREGPRHRATVSVVTLAMLGLVVV